MAVSVEHRWDEPGAPNSVIHATFDRVLSEREANEIGQIIAGLHERHEAQADFAAHDPHHRRHVTPTRAKTWLTETPDLDEQGEPILLGGIAQVTRTFSGRCGDCGRPYAVSTVEPRHYVCPSLPPEHLVRFRATACHEGCAIDCGRPV